jgi:hypothetical protein
MDFPGILNIYALIVSPAPAVTSTLCHFPLVVLQQTSQSFSAPHCSFVPSCFRPRRKQDPVVFALKVALPVVMYETLLQCSPLRRFSKQDQPRQTFFFDRSHRSRVSLCHPAVSVFDGLAMITRDELLYQTADQTPRCVIVRMPTLPSAGTLLARMRHRATQLAHS